MGGGDVYFVEKRRAGPGSRDISKRQTGTLIADRTFLSSNSPHAPEEKTTDVKSDNKINCMQLQCAFMTMSTSIDRFSKFFTITLGDQFTIVLIKEYKDSTMINYTALKNVNFRSTAYLSKNF